MRSMANRRQDRQCAGLEYREGRIRRCGLQHGHDGLCDYRPPPTPQAVTPHQSFGMLDKDSPERAQ